VSSSVVRSRVKALGRTPAYHDVALESPPESPRYDHPEGDGVDLRNTTFEGRNGQTRRNSGTLYPPRIPQETAKRGFSPRGEQTTAVTEEVRRRSAVSVNSW